MAKNGFALRTLQRHNLPANKTTTMLLPLFLLWDLISISLSLSLSIPSNFSNFSYDSLFFPSILSVLSRFRVSVNFYFIFLCFFRFSMNRWRIEEKEKKKQGSQEEVLLALAEGLCFDREDGPQVKDLRFFPFNFC